MEKPDGAMSQGVKKKVTVRDVAKLAGLSVGSVSRVLNTPEKTSSKTRRAVENAIRSLGYEVDSVAQSMRTRATRAVGLLVRDITNPIFGEVAHALQARLATEGYLLVLAGSSADSPSEAQLIAMLRARRMDGLVAFLRDEDDPETNLAIDRFDGPVVLVDRETKHLASRVVSDQAGGMFQATRHLISLGHRRIGLIVGAGNILPGRDRLAGFLRAHQEAGITPDKELIRQGGFHSDFALRETSILLDLAKPPSALIPAGSQLLEGAFKAFRLRGTQVPQDISVVGFDDSALAAIGLPSVTVVRRDLFSTGASAAELLLAGLADPNAKPVRRIVLPTELIVRESTAPPGA